MTQLAKTENDQIKPPAILGSVGIAGLEEMDSDDMVLPRAKLLQGSCEEIKDPDQYPTLRVGMLINTVTKEPLETTDDNGKKSYAMIPVKMFKKWVKFNPQKKEDPDFDKRYEPCALIAQTYDKTDPLALSPDNWKHRQICFLCFQPGTRQPIVLVFGKTSAKTGKDVINFVSLAGRALYEHVLLIGSQTEEKGGNKYSVLTARSVGKPVEADLQTAVQMYREFNPILSNLKTQTSVRIHEDDVPDDSETIDAVAQPSAQQSTTSNAKQWDD